MKFIQLHGDVILEITSFLDLHDSFHLLVTCSSFVSLLSFKDFWQKTMVRLQTVHMQPLPCPVGVDVFDLPMDDLRRLAVHAYRLRKNWSSERATLVSMRTIALGRECRQICVIPGTNLIITSDAERLTCWNTQSGACIAELEMASVDKFYNIGQSPPFLLPGRAFIALSWSYWASDYVEMMVVELDYRNPHNIILAQISSNTWPLPGCQVMTPSDAAVVDDKMAVVAFTNQVDQQSMLAYCNLVDGIVRHIPLGVRLGSFPVCMVKDGNIYIHGRDKGQDEDEPCIVVRVCPASLHPLDNIDRITLGTPSPLPSVYTIFHLHGRPQLRSTPKGVVLLTKKIFAANFSSRGGPGPGTYVPSVQFHSILDSTTRLECVGSASYEHPFSMALLSMGASSSYAVTLDMVHGQEGLKTNLGVVRHEAGSTRASFHALNTGDVELDYLAAMLAVDDALGVVYATHIGEAENSKLYVFSYV
ncbi:hypothetical protein C8R45DRAFT_1095249 [Mycena sanguinolenta]|nr:hypothetical protein C8R45DRAFT_1095249 [Mycena sanguinolenta]